VVVNGHTKSDSAKDTAHTCMLADSRTECSSMSLAIISSFCWVGDSLPSGGRDGKVVTMTLRSERVDNAASYCLALICFLNLSSCVAAPLMLAMAGQQRSTHVPRNGTVTPGS
jgi:hypothetical protein